MRVMGEGCDMSWHVSSSTDCAHDVNNVQIHDLHDFICERS